MATIRQVTVRMLDGTEHVATGSYMGLADRVAMERRFGISFTDLWERGEDGESHPGPAYKDEIAAFFCWRLFSRNGYGGSFDDFVEACEEVVIATPEEAANPTDAAPLPGS